MIEHKDFMCDQYNTSKTGSKKPRYLTEMKEMVMMQTDIEHYFEHSELSERMYSLTSWQRRSRARKVSRMDWWVLKE